MGEIKKGKLIVIDGTDGSGKKTQTDLLIERLKKEGYDTVFFDFPRYGEKSAALVEEYLNGKFGSAKEVGPYKASIFYACDRYAASFEMKKAIESGKIVVCNRYVSSNMGHQAGKIQDKTERDKFLEWLSHLEFGIFEIPKPDINLLLFVSPEIGQALVDKKGHRDYVGGQKRDIHEADLQHLKEASEAYAYVAKKYGWTTIDCTKKREILGINEIHELVWDSIKNRI